MPDRSNGAALTYAVERRLDYIDFRLAVHGSIRRGDIIDVFGVSMGQASGDLAEFILLYPKALRYDKSAKQYVPARKTYRTRRGMTEDVLRAIAALAETGHAMGWRT